MSSSEKTMIDDYSYQKPPKYFCWPILITPVDNIPAEKQVLINFLINFFFLFAILLTKHWTPIMI